MKIFSIFLCISLVVYIGYMGYKIYTDIKLKKKNKTDLSADEKGDKNK